ncbi:serine hydrolase domain-containing protein [Paenibacillus rubinfantis]|uniref:serine hydrolase domain-containing protein n=1 Tax=Paenibacillus rubinfantis TaxID=1720296 RepID=UPI00073E5401|nr:serine hydrolase domain-containing protein [Paenibacillus rubinfantis]
MKKKRNALLAIFLALTLLMPTGAMAAEATETNAAPQSLEEIAAAKAALLTTTYGTTSVQYALVDNGKIIVSGATGTNDTDGNIPLTPETMYGIGSTSKMFTTAAVMKLVDQGKINLDTPLVNYIAEFKMKDERYKQITPRMLLNHSSGLQGSSLTNAFLFEDNDPYAHDTLLDQLADQSLKADPGAYSVYSNDGFTLAELLVERVSGMDFTSYIHKEFTEPLGLKHTLTSQDELDVSKLAAIYTPGVTEQLPNETVNVIGTGGIYSTAEDLVKFAGLFTGEAEDILSEKAAIAMAQPEYKRGVWPKDTDNSFDFGLGWDSMRLFPFNEYGIQALAKGGDTILYHAELVVLPEQNMAAAVLSSGGSSSLNQLLANELLLQALQDNGTIKERKPAKSFGTPEQATMPEELTEYSGFYGATNQLIRIDVADGEINITSPFAPGESLGLPKLVYTKDGTFVSEDGSLKVSFVKEKNGRTYLWERQYATVPELGQLALSFYSAEKLEENALTPDVEAAWKQRDGKSYFLVSEKYSSIAYFIMLPTVQMTRTDSLPGYVLDKQITGPDSLMGKHQIPTTGSRDLAEYRFFTQAGSEYLEAAGSLYLSGDQVKELYPGKKSSVTLRPSEQARWYTVPAKAAGKTITVELPAKASFAVYDAAGVCVNFSVVSGNNEVKLPENGTIVLIGDPGSRFEIELK